jgi:EAL domain-containing protein (putative c-di-GMP-specific phosphodiesterase class I)
MTPVGRVSLRCWYSIATLRKIRAMGVSIAVDDFGTDFSSLSCLSTLPLDTLKIDRSFVMDLTENPDRLAQVSAIVTLARSMNLNIVAEGVETEDQSTLLRMLGCDGMQGFCLASRCHVKSSKRGPSRWRPRDLSYPGLMNRRLSESATSCIPCSVDWTESRNSQIKESFATHLDLRRA